MGNKVKKFNRGARNIFELIVYILTCILTFGVAWLLKIVIKRAMMEANDN